MLWSATIPTSEGGVVADHNLCMKYMQMLWSDMIATNYTM